MPPVIPKYRPVLSGPQILHIISLAKKDGSSASLEIAAILSRMEWQIKNGGLQPAYNETPRESLAESLGFEIVPNPHMPPQTIALVQNDKITGVITNIGSIPALQEALYQKWIEDPTALSVTDIAIVRQYRYENNKMTMDEEKLFEKEVLGFS